MTNRNSTVPIRTAAAILSGTATYLLTSNGLLTVLAAVVGFVLVGVVIADD
ncbi:MULTISPECIES: hypothetical protein [Streptomyces]|uniref:hypothetical protein n=1 Tax=Streptomyces TaxID=1883 RepID=UPI0029B5D186|nr:hypothetical protein [Streptomyces scabiei]MDX3205082.1 hypothetical protein [Streptomyces scabiei]